MQLRHIFVAGLLVTATGAGGWWYIHESTVYPATADAYVGRHVVRIAAQVSGPIVQVSVDNHQAVKAGDLLFAIDPAPFELAVRQAEARLQQVQESLAAADAQVDVAKAQLATATANAQEAARHAGRINALAAKGSASKDADDSAQQARLDAQDALASAKAALAAAIATRGAIGDDNAGIKGARAARAQARLDLEHTRITAPADGTIGELDLRPGSFVTAGDQLFALVEDAPVWVNANFKETDLPRIRPGQPATVSVDLLPGSTFRGVVEDLSPASGAAFSLFPPENATGNWVKVTQRFDVRVRILDPVPELRMGASAEVQVDTVAQVETVAR